MNPRVEAATSVVDDMKDRAGAAADFIKKLGNPNRLMIVCALVEGEKSVGELEAQLGIRQPALSQQLAELREAGLIVGKRAVKQVYYSLDDARARAFAEFVHRLFCRDDLGAMEPALAAPRVKHMPSQAAVFARARINRG